MRCWFKAEPHESEDCPVGRAAHGGGHLNGSGPAGREVERGARHTPALPLAQADDELDHLVRFKEGRVEATFTPPPGPGSPLISLDSRRPGASLVRRTDAAEELVRAGMAALWLAERQGIEVIEVDRLDYEALLLHEAALMRVIEWASLFGPGCTCNGGYVCSWHAGLADAMETEETA